MPALEKIKTFHLPVFTKPTNGQQHCVQTSYTELHPNRAINVETMDTYFFTPLRKVWLSIVTKRVFARQVCVKNFCIEFHENSINVLVA
jgi:hypothetical protein